MTSSGTRRLRESAGRDRDGSRMRRPLVTAAWLLAVVAPLVTHAGTAAADDKQACVAASEKAQQLRSAGKLVEARQQLTVCGSAGCPRMIQQDCTQWMTEVLATLPSVVPGAKDKKGRDIVDARLAIDGEVVTQTLDGKPIVLDPGVHSFVFEATRPGGAPPVKEQVVIKPGEKNRIVSVTIAMGDEGAAGTGPSTAGAGTAGAGAGKLATESPGSSPPIAAYVFGGLGLVALGAALVVDLGASSDARGLRDTCAPSCRQDDVDTIRTKYTVAGVTAGIGGALLVTGIVLFVMHGKGEQRSGGLAPRLSLPSAADGAPAALLRF